MKLLSPLLAAFFVSSLKTIAQPVDIKPEFTPNHVYTLIFKGHIDCDVDIAGKSPVVALNLEAKGMKFPVHAMEATTIKAKATTANADAAGNIPFTFQYVQAKSQGETSNPAFGNINDPSDKDVNSLNGHRLKGKVSAKGKIQIDSVTNMGITESDISRQDMINFFELEKLGHKKLMPGESFTTKDSYELTNIENTSIKINRKITYKLIEVKDNKAYFDVSQQVINSFDNSMRLQSKATGQGSGKLVFDLINKMPVEYSNDLKVKISIPFTDVNNVEINYHALAYNAIQIN